VGEICGEGEYAILLQSGAWPQKSRSGYLEGSVAVVIVYDVEASTWSSVTDCEAVRSVNR